MNIDHVATLRNARGGEHPDPIRAARAGIEAGADGITAHLREDRRHIRDEDIARLKAEIAKPLNLEMAPTDEMLAIALETRPHAACLVPERREERTTEGGLDAAAQHKMLKPVVFELTKAGVAVALFIAAEPAQIRAAAELGAPAIEIHTGSWCDAIAADDRRLAAAEWQRIVEGARLARQLGLEVHAGHGLNYETAEQIATIADGIAHCRVHDDQFANRRSAAVAGTPARLATYRLSNMRWVSTRLRRKSNHQLLGHGCSIPKSTTLDSGLRSRSRSVSLGRLCGCRHHFHRQRSHAGAGRGAIA